MINEQNLKNRGDNLNRILTARDRDDLIGYGIPQNKPFVFNYERATQHRHCTCWKIHTLLGFKKNATLAKEVETNFDPTRLIVFLHHVTVIRQINGRTNSQADRSP